MELVRISCHLKHTPEITHFLVPVAMPEAIPLDTQSDTWKSMKLGSTPHGHLKTIQLVFYLHTSVASRVMPRSKETLTGIRNLLSDLFTCLPVREKVPIHFGVVLGCKGGRVKEKRRRKQGRQARQAKTSQHKPRAASEVSWPAVSPAGV